MQARMRRRSAEVEEGEQPRARDPSREDTFLNHAGFGVASLEEIMGEEEHTFLRGQGLRVKSHQEILRGLPPPPRKSRRR